MNHFWKYHDDSFFNRCKKCGCNRVHNVGTHKYVYYYDEILKPIYNNPICSPKNHKNEKEKKDRVGKATFA